MQGTTETERVVRHKQLYTFKKEKICNINGKSGGEIESGGRCMDNLPFFLFQCDVDAAGSIGLFVFLLFAETTAGLELPVVDRSGFEGGQRLLSRV